MRRQSFILIVLAVLFGSAFVEAQTVELTGFADFFYAVKQDSNEMDDFEFGQLEIDLETVIGENIVVAAAIAYNPGGEIFESGAFTVDFHLFGSEGDHFRPSDGIDHSGILFGQFDIPFGIDWNVYVPVDRRLVTYPLVVENTHDAWNDFGLQGYVESGMINAVLFAVNGFGYETGYDATGSLLGYNGVGYDPDDITLIVQDNGSNLSVGGRLGIKPNDMIEFGGSYAGFFNDADKMDMSLVGADLQLKRGSLSVKGEYIIQGMGLDGSADISNNGFYAQGHYDFGKYFVVARYGMYSPDASGVDELTRLSAGAGFVIVEGAELRGEYQTNSGDDDDVVFLQLVVGF